jgi:hypothetical protein
VIVVALHGVSCETASIQEAIEFIEHHDEKSGVRQFCRYEVQIRYSNADEVRGSFTTKAEAVRFLDTFR